MHRLAQEEIQSITRMMEASGFLSNRKSQTSANFYLRDHNHRRDSNDDGMSSVTNGSDRDERASTTSESSGQNYVDLDKMFAFLADLQTERKLQNSGLPPSNSSITSSNSTLNGHHHANTLVNGASSMRTTANGLPNSSQASSNNNSITAQFDSLISETQAHLSQLDDDVSSTNNTRPKTTPIIANNKTAAVSGSNSMTHTIQAPVPVNPSTLPVNPTPLLSGIGSSSSYHPQIPHPQVTSKPTQEVAPILVNGTQVDHSHRSSSSLRMTPSNFERPVYAPVMNLAQSSSYGQFHGSNNNISNNNNTPPGSSSTSSTSNSACPSPGANQFSHSHQMIIQNGIMDPIMKGQQINRPQIPLQHPMTPPQQQQQQQLQQQLTEADMRRKMRVDRKLQQIQEEPENSINNNGNGINNNVTNKTFDMIEFADRFFNHHPRNGKQIKNNTNSKKKKSSFDENSSVSSTGSSNGSTTGDYLTRAEMLTYNPNNIIPSSHIRMSDQENSLIAVSLFKDLQKYLQGEQNNMKTDMEIKIIQGIIGKGIEREELRDEIFVQLMRQINNNPSRQETLRGWMLLGLTTSAFNPSKVMNRYFQSFIRKNLRKDAAISCYAQFSLDNILPKTSTAVVVSSRRHPPSSMEINAIKTLSSLVCRFYFMDGRTKAIDVHPCDTALDAMNTLASKIGLRSLEGWALYDSNSESDRVIRSHDYLADVIYVWEKKQKELLMTQGKSSKDKVYGSISKGSTLTSPDSTFKFIFKKRLFKNTREIPHDPVEVNLLYSQAVFSVVKKDEYPVSERIALQLAGLQAQISLGEFDVKANKTTSLEKYEDVESYLCRRIRRAVITQSSNSGQKNSSSTPSTTRSKMDWSLKISEAHRMYGAGKSDLIAKVWYLSVVMQYPLYGTTLFPIQYKGYHVYPLQNNKSMSSSSQHSLLIGVNSEGVLIISPNDKSILNAYRYSDIECLSVYAGHAETTGVDNNLITIKLLKSLAEQQQQQAANNSHPNNVSKFFTFESKDKEEIASLITSYCPTLNPWTAGGVNNHINNPMAQVMQPVNRRLLKMSLEDRMKFHQEVMNCRKVLIESGRLRKAMVIEESSPKGMFSTLRKLNKSSSKPSELSSPKSGVTLKTLGKEFETEAFKSFPHCYWAYTKYPILNSLMVISDPEQESDSVNNFNLILAYSGLSLLDEDNVHESIYDTAKNEWQSSKNTNRDPIILAQRIIGRVLIKESSDIFKNEFFLQLIKQTTDHPDPNSKINIKHWHLLALATSITCPTDRRVLSYLHAHLRKCSLDSVTEEGLFASFCLKNLQGTLETRGRKYGPSKSEVISTINRRRIYARIHFLDGQFQAVEFDACATISEVMQQIQLKIGLRPNVPGYALYQVLGDEIEQSLQPEDKVGDALSLWEKWHEDHIKASGSTSTQLPQHYFIFKKHLLIDSLIDFSDRVERELLYHDFVHKIRSDKFPLSSDLEAVMLCALKAQIDEGDFRDCNIEYSTGMMTMVDYRKVMETLLPVRMLNSISPEQVMSQHQSMKGIDNASAKKSFFNLIKSWPLYRSTMFHVQQTYTSLWPKNLWLAVDSTGIHLLQVKSRNLLASCDYRSIIDYSPSSGTSLIIVTLNSTPNATNNSTAQKSNKFLFLTIHAHQIASLIKDYTSVMEKGQPGVRRKSVDFDLVNKPPIGSSIIPRKGNPPLPPPRPSLSSRQQFQQISQQQPMSPQDVYGNIYGSSAGGQQQYLTFTGQQQPMNGNAQDPQQPFQPHHRRGKPMSILYKPPPAITTTPEHV